MFHVEINATMRAQPSEIAPYMLVEILRSLTRQNQNHRLKHNKHDAHQSFCPFNFSLDSGILTKILEMNKRQQTFKRLVKPMLFFPMRKSETFTTNMEQTE
jgi:hypothetical protein